MEARKTRQAFNNWLAVLSENVFESDLDFKHCVQFYNLAETEQDLLASYGEKVATLLEPLVHDNTLPFNLPRLVHYNSIGQRIDKIVYHPNYIAAGDIIYQSGLLKKLTETDGLKKCLSLFFLSSQVGEAGHHCPIACSAGIIRVFAKIAAFEHKDYYLNQLLQASFTENFTGAQFVTEIQGGSDVGLNETKAINANGIWQITGEKWFCSNAGADLILLTARFDESLHGTKGLGLFLVPALWKNEKNSYHINRLKDKIGTQLLPTGEIEFQAARAIAMGAPQDGFHLLMNNVLHLSRLFNTFSVLGMGRRAYTIASSYAQHRIAFNTKLADFPLIHFDLMQIKSENDALLAAAFRIAHLQDEADNNKDETNNLLLRLLVNMLKYLSSNLTVKHIHSALGILAGNGTILNFSSLPRLLQDALVCETWEGTHHVLRMQIFKDINNYHVDELFLQAVHVALESMQSSHYYANMKNTLDLLVNKIASFKNLAQEQQLLQIKPIVDAMACYYCGFALLLEAEDQAKRGVKNKHLSFELFFEKYLAN